MLEATAPEIIRTPTKPKINVGDFCENIFIVYQISPASI